MQLRGMIQSFAIPVFVAFQNTRWYHPAIHREKVGIRKGLNVDPLVSVPFQVPAGTVAEVGKERAHAHLALRLRKVEFGSAILLVNRVVGLNGDGRKLFAALRNLVPD